MSETSGLLDLSEDGLDDLFSGSLAAAVAGVPEPSAHGLNLGAAFRIIAAFGVFLPAGGYIGPDMPLLQCFKVGLGTIACVGGDLLGFPAGLGVDPVRRGNPLRLVAGVRGEAASDDDPMGAVHSAERWTAYPVLTDGIRNNPERSPVWIRTP